jgi:hypothetical protein
MRRVLLSLLLAACAPGASDETPDDAGNAHCDSARNIAALPAKLHEASGVAASTRHTGILWVHNDSGEPIIFAIDTLGNERARVRISLPNTDWEDIAVAPCPEGSCIYLGAIGDNLQRRQDRAVLRFPEPDLKATTPIKPVKLRYRLPNGAHDTEALFVLPDARIFLVTKGRSGPITVFRFPDQPSAEDVNALEEVQQLTPGLVQLPDMVTGADAMPDGKVIAIRTYSALQLYAFDGPRLAPLLPVTGFDLQPLGEFQGEGVAITQNGSVYLVSEKGLADEDPRLSKVSCSLRD